MSAHENAAATPAGLQAERTDLSWSRTALAFAVNGALLLFRFDLAAPLWMHVSGAALAILLLLFTMAMSSRRRRVLRQRPLPVPLAGHQPILLLALGSGLLAVLTLLLVLAPLLQSVL